MLPIKDVMVTKMVTVSKETSIYEAARLLVEHRITGIPVVDDDRKLVGILSEFDILRLLVDDDVKKGKNVEDFMTHQVISLEDDITAIDACEFFLNNPSKRRVPIIHDGKLVGIVTRGDIVKLIVSLRKQ